MPGLEEKTVQKKTALSGKKKKWLYAVVAAVLLAAAAGIFVMRGSSSQVLTISPTDTARLVRCDLQDHVTTTGTVESAKSMTVYSTKTYTVQEVLVEVGDRVEEGQLLCGAGVQTVRLPAGAVCKPRGALPDQRQRQRRNGHALAAGLRHQGCGVRAPVRGRVWPPRAQGLDGRVFQAAGAHLRQL